MTRGLPEHLRAWFLRGPVVRELREMLGAAPAGGVAVILGGGVSRPETIAADVWRDLDGRRVAVLPLPLVRELCGVRSPATAARLGAEGVGEGFAWCCYVEGASATTWRLPLHPPPSALALGAELHQGVTAKGGAA